MFDRLPPFTRNLIRGAVVFAMGGERMAWTRGGFRKVQPVNLHAAANGEVGMGAARGRRSYQSSKALNNTPSVVAPGLDVAGITILTCYAWEPPNYIGQSWNSVDAFTGNSVGYFMFKDGAPYTYTGGVQYGGDWQVACQLNVSGTVYGNAYAEVGWGSDKSRPGPLTVAMRWTSGSKIILSALDQFGGVIRQGTAASASTPTGTVTLPSWAAHYLCGFSTPDSDGGSLMPTLFAGTFPRALSDAELSRLVRDACRATARPGSVFTVPSTARNLLRVGLG